MPNLRVTGVPHSKALGSRSLSQPLPIPGTYYYGVVRGLGNRREAIRRTTARHAVTVTVGGAPDLVVDTLTVSESAPVVGAQFTLSVTVRNQGSVSSGSTTLRYYLSSDSTISSSATSAGTDPVAGLAASGSSAQSVSLTTLGAAGTYYYWACVDPVTGENEVANNCSAAVTVAVAGTHDLVVDAPPVDTSGLAAGAQFTLTATVRNQGRGPSSYFATLRYYRSSDSTITTRDTELGTDVVNRLEPSESEDESISLTAPASPGTYYYGACVDPLSDEDDMSNNCSAAVRIILVPADLVVDTPKIIYSNPNVQDFFPMDVPVRNQGNFTSESTTLNFYRSTDSTITTSDELINSHSVSALSPSDSLSLHRNLLAPSEPGTAYYYGACVVPPSNESNTTNNCSPSVKIVGSDFDLVVEPPWISHPSVTASTETVTSTMDLHAVVRTQGTGHLPNLRVTSFSVYRSTDSTATSDRTVESHFIWRPADVGSNSEGTTVSEGITVEVYAPRTAGEYYFHACVDGVTGESNTTNNCSESVKVTVSPPDLMILLPTVSSYNTTAGASFTLYATVLNRGDVGSGDYTTTIRYYRSEDATISSADVSVGTDRVIVPKAHALGDKSITLTAPSTAGTYYYGACVDSVSDESDTTNNCSAAVEMIVGARPLTLQLTSCFVFQQQHFVRFRVTGGGTRVIRSRPYLPGRKGKQQAAPDGDDKCWGSSGGGLLRGADIQIVPSTPEITSDDL